MNTLSCSLAVQDLILKLFSHPCFSKEVRITGGRSCFSCPRTQIYHQICVTFGEGIFWNQVTWSKVSTVFVQSKMELGAVVLWKNSDSQGHSASFQTIEDYINKLSWCLVRVGKEWWIQVGHGLQSCYKVITKFLISTYEKHATGLHFRVNYWSIA